MNGFHVYLLAAFSVSAMLVGLFVIDDEICRECREGKCRWWQFIGAAILLGLFWPLTVVVGAWHDLRGKNKS